MVFVLLGLFWLAIAGLVGLDTGGRGVALLVLGTALGAVFLSFQYGFASGWRHFIVAGKTMALAAHFLLAALCALIVIPADLWGLTASGSLAPISVSLFVGAFAFTGTACQWVWLRRVVQLRWRIRENARRCLFRSGFVDWLTDPAGYTGVGPTATSPDRCRACATGTYRCQSGVAGAAAFCFWHI